MQPRVWHDSYDPGVPPALQYADWTLPDLLDRAAARFPGRPALRFGNRRYSWSGLARAVERAAAGLAALGVQPGERVAIHLPNTPQTVIAFQAVQRLGAVAVMTNPLYSERELEHQWGDAGCTLAITTDWLWAEHVRALRPRLALRSVVVTGLAEGLAPPLSWLARFALARRSPPRAVRVRDEPGLVRWRRLFGEHPAAPRPVLAPQDLATLQYTGGTTGVSKACMLSHANLCANVQQLAAWIQDFRVGEEVALLALPLFHVFGLSVGMNLAVHAAAQMVVIPDPRDTRRMLRSIERRRVTALPAVPALFEALSRHPDAERRDLSSLRLCVSGSAPLSPQVAERFAQHCGQPVVEGFGMSETSPVTHATPLASEPRPGSVGLPLPDTDARVADPDSFERERPVGEAGELWVRGPQVMSAYWGQPEESAAVLRDGWLRTGDLATVDEQGWFRIVGRLKDVVLVGGYNVYPDEIDAVLCSHPAVLEAASVGLPGEAGAERVKSFVVARQGMSPSATELDAHCREQLAAYKVPREFELIEELPRSAVLKVLRRELVERELARRAGQGSP